jgi:hypothetical protein
MESLGFVLMYFLRGSLPWQGLKANTKKQKYQRILERKQATHPEQLCRGYPSEFRDYFAHCSAMGFEDRPDYRYLKRIFKDLFDRQGFMDDGLYDWDIMKKQQEAAGVSGGSVGAAVAGGTSLVPGPGVDDGDKLQEDGLRGASAAANPGGVLGTGRSREDQSKTEEEGEAKEAVQRRSIISSIR